MNKICKAFVILLSVICFVCIFVGAKSILSVKTSYEKNEGVYSKEASFDVIFLGSSHMIMGVSPMELWKDYGITSYNLSDYGQWIPVDYWALVNALDYQKPDLVVIDVHAISLDEKYSSERMAQVHDIFDCMPLSKNKIAAINDLMEKDRRMEFLFPFSFYHSRWNDLTEEDFLITPTVDNGANLDAWDAMEYAQIRSYNRPVMLEPSDKYDDQSIGVDYLKKMIELCQARGIDIALVALPYYASDSDQRWLNGVNDIAGEYGVKFYNMNLDCSYINFATDLFDEGHLDSSGARKVTKVLGQWMIDNYDLSNVNNRDDSVLVESWNQDYGDFAAKKISWLQEQTTLESYLMLLNDDMFTKTITVREDWIVTDSSYTEFFNELLNGGAVINVDSKAGIDEEDSQFLVKIEVINNITGEEVDTVYYYEEKGIFRK